MCIRIYLSHPKQKERSENMQETKSVNRTLIFSDSDRREKISFALKCVGYAAISLLLSRARVFNNLSPFGVAFAAASPPAFSTAAALGAIVGYLLTFSGTAGIRYMACVVGVALILWLIRKTGQASKNQWFTPLAASLCCASTGMAVLLAQGFSVNGMLTFLCDCVLSGGMTYFFSQTLSRLSKRENILFSGKKAVICAVVSCCAVLMSLADVSFLSFNPARMAGAFLIMLFAFLLRESGGAFSGVCTGIALSAVCGYIPLGGLFSAAGLVSGLFYSFGQLGIAAAFVSVCGLHAIISPSPEGIAVIAESAVAAVFFVLLPRTKLNKLRLSFSEKSKIKTDKSTQKVCRKLEDAKSALTDVSSCVETVSRELSKVSVNDSALIGARVKQSVCESCPRKQACLDENSSIRNRAFKNIFSVLRQDGHVVPGDFDLDFQKICVRKARLAQTFNKVFVDSTAAVCAGAKNRQLRQVVSDQFKSMADILGEISVDLSREPVFLSTETSASKDVFESFGLEVVFCECMRNVNGRACLAAEFRDIPKETDFSDLVSTLRRALGIRFSFPAVTDSENGVTAVFDEKPTYRFELGCVQKTSGESNLCGDCFECFRNGDESDMIVISDGMGTGGRAAVDSAMATNLFSTLVKAGLSCETSLKITNSALLAKSEEETLSTLDIARLDPFSGTVDFYKAGGAPCFVRKGGRTAALEQVSLPAGILRDINFSTAQTKLSKGDILLMVSDGVLVDDGKWIHKILRSWSGDAQFLAEYIAAMAHKRHKDVKADDMTVVCVTVEEI